jgi:putative endonuclease
MTQRRLTLGRQGEEVAARYLEKKGLKILARNVRTPVGEIDLVARQRGTPAEAVGRRKQRQIVQAAKWYLGDDPNKTLQPRFDVVAFLLGDHDVLVEHIPGAFDA